MAAATATSDPPGYFVGRPLHYQDQQPQAVVPPPAPVPAPAVDDHNNAANTQVPGYYAGRVQPRSREDTQHGSSSSSNNNNPNELGFFARWFGCLSGSSGNAN